MNLIDKLRLKNVSVEVINNTEKHFHEQWQEKFAGNLNKSEKNKIYLDQYLWHIFSYQKVEHLERGEAMEAFNNIKKDECYAFYQHDDILLKLNNLKDIKAEDFSSEEDIYIVDKSISWTYVHTHEEYCGPYFYKINSK